MFNSRKMDILVMNSFASRYSHDTVVQVRITESGKMTWVLWMGESEIKGSRESMVLWIVPSKRGFEVFF